MSGADGSEVADEHLQDFSSVVGDLLVLACVKMEALSGQRASEENRSGTELQLSKVCLVPELAVLGESGRKG